MDMRELMPAFVTCLKSGSYQSRIVQLVLRWRWLGLVAIGHNVMLRYVHVET